MAAKENTFDLELARQLPTMTLEEARKEATSMIETLPKSESPRVQRIIRDISAARSVEHITGIIWRVQLAFEGLRAGDSWVKQYS